MVLPHQRAEQLDGRHRRAGQVRRVDTDHAGHPVGVQQRHLPHHQTAPVVADEDGSLDVEDVQQPHQVAAEVGHVVVGHRRGPGAAAVPALVWRDGPEPGIGHRGELAAPRVGQLGEAVAEHHGGTPAGLVDRERHVTHLDLVVGRALDGVAHG